ncbi:MAG: helix-turn-helix domain-containing protein [Bryobacteraceae bacterium]
MNSLDELLDNVATRIASKLQDAARRQQTTKTHARLLNVREAATYLGRTKDAVQHLGSSGKLPIVRSDKRVFFDVRDLDRWIEQNKRQQID